ncbi:aldo/keto reductase [Streptomyces sp. NBC_00986]|uniref:aldo/keto reductase n=1 Tax=Streptomyces sp. NBC_00986 TaxID=2903702 RepID=UPI00386A5258|nr:aldo/keto reductase [Streptomyces sp. NBC_00986]
MGDNISGVAKAQVSIGGNRSVNRIGYGAMQLTGKQVWGEYPDREGGIALLRQAVDSGVGFIDTADVYGPHTNETLVHDALYPYPDHLVIATKGGFVRGGFDYATLDAVGNRNYLRQSAHLSARRLGVERIDLYYLHSGRATDAPFEEQVATLAELRDEGVIGSIGLSNVTVEQFEAARAIVDIAAVTAHYNIAVRTGAGLLKAAEANGAVFSPWHPVTLNETGQGDRIREVLEPIARRHGATVQQTALAWHLHHSPATLPIPGTTSPVHLRENLAAGAIHLTAEEVARIDALTPDA